MSVTVSWHSYWKVKEFWGDAVSALFLGLFFDGYVCGRESFCLRHRGPWNAIARVLESTRLVSAQRQERRDSPRNRFDVLYSQLCPGVVFLLSVEMLWLSAAQGTRASGATAPRDSATCCQQTHALPAPALVLVTFLSSFSSPIILFISLVWLQISCWALKVLIVGCGVYDLWRLV